MGHDDWVNSVAWHRSACRLVSASADKTIIIWEPDDHSLSWIPKYRLGEMGGHTLGFRSAVFANNGMVIANGFHGALQQWELVNQSWNPVIGSSGHQKSVQQCAWDPSGSYLLTASLDQTCRIFCQWHTTQTWHEIARTQIHGYDMRCISFLNKYQYVSGADEKVFRIFTAPQVFAESLANITGVAQGDTSHLPLSASLPALGLSNKALTGADTFHDSFAPQTTSTPLNVPPFEQTLLQDTLWPEVDKVYGHGFEIVSLATNPTGTLIASSCKASQPEHAAVRLYSPIEKTEACSPLVFHTLTVTSISFSPNGKYLLTAGRDRSFALYHLENISNKQCDLLYSQKEAHQRIIWKTSFAYNCAMFCTASRDKTVKFWSFETALRLVGTMEMDASITAVEFAPGKWNEMHVIALGLENGEVYTAQLRFEPVFSVTNKQHLSTNNRGAIKSVSWRPGYWQLATCSDDCSVDILDVHL